MDELVESVTNFNYTSTAGAPDIVTFPLQAEAHPNRIATQGGNL